MAEEEVVPTGQEKARQHGWVPQEDWAAAGKNPDDWVDYREFNYRGELMGRITSQSQELKTLRAATANYDKRLEKLGKAVSMLTDQNKRLAQDRLKEERAELLHYRAEAEVEGDAAKMAAIDEDLAKLKDTETELNETPTIEDDAQQQAGQMTPEQQVEFREWVKDNPWYVTNPQAAGYANFVAGTLDREGKSFGEYLNEVAEAVQAVFGDHSDEGEETPRKKQTVLEPGANGTRTRSKKSYADRLNQGEREIGRTFVEEGLFKSLEDYAKHLLDE